MWNRKHKHRENDDRSRRIAARRHALDIASRMRMQNHRGDPVDGGARRVVEFARTIAPWLEQATEDGDLQTRVAALEQVVANVCGHVGSVDQSLLMANAHTFYDFLIAEPEPAAEQADAVASH